LSDERPEKESATAAAAGRAFGAMPVPMLAPHQAAFCSALRPVATPFRLEASGANDA